MYIDTTQAFRPIICWDIEWFHRLHFLLDILLYSRFGFVVGALSSLRLSVMLTQITIQSSNTVIWQVIRLHENEFTCKPMNCSRLQHFYFCGPTWIRTTDTCIFSAVLYQLSYRPNKAFLPVESSKTTINCWQGGIRTHGGVLLVGLTARTVRPLRQPTNFLVTPPGFEPGTHWLKVSYSSQLS